MISHVQYFIHCATNYTTDNTGYPPPPPTCTSFLPCKTVDQHSNESSLIKILKQQFYINSSCVILVIH